MLEISVSGTHSLRSGGDVVANAGISDRLFKRHGRWSSDLAKDGYVKDSLFSPLSISIVFLLFGLARGTVDYGVQLAGFPPKSKWTYGEVFHPTVVPRPHFS